MLLTGVCEKTSVCLLVDKEEIGNVGATGMQSKFLKYMVIKIMEAACGVSQTPKMLLNLKGKIIYDRTDRHDSKKI